ncbi:uncharacterized protein LOC116345761 [Contarinia nasturtii]|uniref:uncharacterized protein LOC116345761 n=1 Tax=Contarinia nasturtii TaxID=265458 RepID=UPI0012D4A062|nr:uncharacterized protein LOC116345761 [Contarinia nasturtii]XP_031631288.1 uncharacterized protein LOC116345761 [Contarinia nasturtii]
MNMDIPPRQDSPNHILNALNNDCIREILIRLYDLEDFLSASKVCVQFEECSLQCPSSKLRMVKINSYLSFDNAKTLFKTFGHLIREIELERRDEKPSRLIELFKMIETFCRKNLTSLRITIGSADVFSKVLDMCSFPKLECLGFDSVSDITTHLLRTLLSLNPQLKRLELLFCIVLPFETLQIISRYAPNIESLDFVNSCFYSHDEITILTDDETIVPLASLQHLKELDLGDVFYETYEIKIDKLINKFAAKNTPIEKLFMSNYEKEDFQSSLPTLKTLEHMGLDGDTPLDSLKIILQYQTSLKSLCFNVRFMRSFTMESLLEHVSFILKFSSKNLSEISYLAQEFDIAIKDYENVVNLVKNRILIKIENFDSIDTTKDIPKHTLKINEKWLCINSVFNHLS